MSSPHDILPHAGFQIPRQFVRGIAVVYTAPPVTSFAGANPLAFTYSEFGYYQTSFITIDPFFFDWSSGTWKLEDVITDEHTYALGVPVDVGARWSLEWHEESNTGCGYVEVNYYTAPTRYLYNLPTPPPSYWLPTPNCSEFLP